MFSHIVTSKFKVQSSKFKLQAALTCLLLIPAGSLCSGARAATLDNEPVKIVFSSNSSGNFATDFGDASAFFVTSKVTYGSNLTLKGLDSNGIGMTQFEPLTQQNEPSGGTAADESNAIRFLFQPNYGLTFTPTKVSLKATRFGTDNGLLDFSWQNPDKSTVSLAVGEKPNRNNNNPNFSEYAYDVTGAKPAEGTCGLLVNLYHLQSGKQVGFTDIVIEGMLSGTEKEVPVLATITVNGKEYTAAEVFDDAYEADFELSKTVPMVSADNPVTATALSGQVGTITYEGDQTHCVVTIPMSNGDTTVSYILNVIQKPDFTLYYISPEDGTTVLTTQQVEKDSPIGYFQGDVMSNYGIPNGCAMRGWFVRSDGGRKYTVDDIVTSNLNLYGYYTEIETPSTHKKYVFDLTSTTFYAEDHEAFDPEGEGYYYHDAQHGWAFQNGNKVHLLVGPKATVTITLCKYGNAKAITITDAAGNTLGTLPGMDSAADGSTVNFDYEGQGGTITLNMESDGEMYIHAVKIVNTAETNYQKQDNWYFVKAGDASSFLEVLDLVNSTNAKKDAERSFIFLPAGTYDLRQTVKVPVSGHNISIIGQSMDRTIIKTKPDISIEGLGKADMLSVTGTNLYLQDLTLWNALDYYNAGSAGRAAVIQDAGNRTIGKNVRMISCQDTYYSSNASMQSYYEDCDIHGTVDFICGGGDVRFVNTQLSLEPRQTNGTGSRTIVAPNGKVKFGYVFDHCTVVDLANGKGSWNLGRTWNNQPVCVYLNTMLDDNARKTLVKSRWTEKGMNNTDPVLFGEYNTTDAAGSNITPQSNIIHSYGGDFQTILTAEQADNYSYQKMFSENSEKQWKPANMTHQKETPDNVVYVNGSVSFVGDAYLDIPERYEWVLFKNGEFVGLILGNDSFPIDIDPTTDALTVRGINLMGGFGPEAPVAGTAASIQRPTSDTQHPTSVYNLQGLRVSNTYRGLVIQDGRKMVR